MAKHIFGFLPAGDRGVKLAGVGVWAHHQLPALLCTLLEDAGVDLLWKDPALLSLLPSWDLPVHPSTMREPHPSAPQVSAEPCSSGGSSPVCWARRKFPSEREWSSPAMFTHHSVPGSPPLSCTPIFVGTGGASHFSERPCKVKNKTAKTSLPRLDTVPRLCTNTAPCPTIVPVL